MKSILSKIISVTSMAFLVSHCAQGGADSASNGATASRKTASFPLIKIPESNYTAFAQAFPGNDTSAFALSGGGWRGFMRHLWLHVQVDAATNSAFYYHCYELYCAMRGGHHLTASDESGISLPTDYALASGLDVVVGEEPTAAQRAVFKELGLTVASQGSYYYLKGPESFSPTDPNVDMRFFGLQ